MPKLCLILFLVLKISFLFGKNYIEINSNTIFIKPGNGVFILEDSTRKLTIEEVIRSNDFFIKKEEVLNLGVSSSCFWIKLNIKKNLISNNTFLLQISNPSIDDVTFYSIQKRRINKVVNLGTKNNFYNRLYTFPNFIFPLSLEPNLINTYYLKIQSGKQITVPILIGQEKPLIDNNITKELVFGIYFGIIIVMILYNLFLFFLVKDNNYLFYVIYIFFVGLSQAEILGYTHKFFWPNISWISQRSFYFIIAFSGITTVLFVKSFLKTRLHVPKYNKLLNLIIISDIIGILLAINGDLNTSFRVIDSTAGIGCLIVLFIAFKVKAKGFPPANFFIIAFTSFMVAVSTYVAMNNGIIPYSNFTPYVMPLGSAIETILLSFALASRINTLKRENEEKQIEIIKQLKQNESYLIAWQEASILNEKLKKETLSAQYESLKNQVNPHFLFNSLNVLTELLYQNQDQAALFINELGKVYRYVLDSKNEETITLQKELEFIDAYIFLLKIRFDKKLIIDIDLPHDPYLLIAPLTFQLLIENAVKHNILSEEAPLMIKIYLEDEYFVVKNNLQTKRLIERSSKLGLKNIKERYSFLTHLPVKETISENFFVIQIPILKKKKPMEQSFLK